MYFFFGTLHFARTQYLYLFWDSAFCSHPLFVSFMGLCVLFTPSICTFFGTLHFVHTLYLYLFWDSAFCSHSLFVSFMGLCVLFTPLFVPFLGLCILFTPLFVSMSSHTSLPFRFVTNTLILVARYHVMCSYGSSTLIGYNSPVSATLKKEAAYCFLRFVPIYQTVSHHIS